MLTNLTNSRSVALLRNTSIYYFDGRLVVRLSLLAEIRAGLEEGQHWGVEPLADHGTHVRYIMVNYTFESTRGIEILGRSFEGAEGQE